MISTNGERPIRALSPPPIPTGSNSSRLVDEVRRRNNIISVLMSVHTVRVIGSSFVIGVSLGILSPIFGYTAGIGDILIGVTAIPMAYFLRRGHRLAANVSIVWNILGSIDLVAAIFLGITTSNPQLSAVVYHASNTHLTMTTMAWVLIPGIGVPILLTTHNHSLDVKRNKYQK
jgi:hypothetical protein